MAYTKQNFTDGNILQASQLEKIEDAIIENENKVGNIKSPTKVSELENDAGYLKSYTETDPTVPAWAKAAKKPSYTASEVGADPAGTAANLLKAYTETDPTVPAWAKAATKPSYTAGEVGADPAGTAVGVMGEHNVDPDAHNDIRIFLEELSARLNAVANSDDTTLDQMAEVVAYIKANRDLIDQITTDKVSVSDIINNLTTNVSNKPLSAAQGVALKALADGASAAAARAQESADNISVPTKTSQLENDSGYITSVPVTSVNGKTGQVKLSASDVGASAVEDIVNNLTTNVNNKPLSAAQGVALKLLIDTNASDIETMQRVINAVTILAEETADTVYKITPRVVGERLVFGGAST